MIKVVMMEFVMKNLISFSHALADETRLRVIHLLLNDALCVCELADILKMPQSSVSSHVQVIRKAGMLDSERREKWIYYRVAASHRQLVEQIDAFFEVSAETHNVLKTDARNAVKRLAKRESSCCPRPEALAKFSQTTTH